MRIEKVEGLLIGSDLLGANYVVRITTDTGITGVGQSGAWGFPDATQKVVEQYTGHLIGLTQEYLQLDESPRPADTVYRTACKRVGGYIPAPEAPGIGVELDEGLLGKAPPVYMPTTSLLRTDGSPALAI